MYTVMSLKLSNIVAFIHSLPLYSLNGILDLDGDNPKNKE